MQCAAGDFNGLVLKAVKSPSAGGVVQGVTTQGTIMLHQIWGFEETAACTPPSKSAVSLLM